MTTPRQHLSVFAKDPRAGFAKTRLIPALGAQGAADLARRLIMHTVTTASSLDRSQVQSLEICTLKNDSKDWNDKTDFFAIWAAEQTPPSRWLLTEQVGDDLGARLHHALSSALTQADRAIAIGTDSPALTAASLAQAFQALADNDAVFIPAFDGGYALVGLRAPLAAIFTDMPWGTSKVMATTRERLMSLKKSWYELPSVHDIDEPADLEHLPADWLS